jgi:hypothetical protein
MTELNFGLDHKSKIQDRDGVSISTVGNSPVNADDLNPGTTGENGPEKEITQQHQQLKPPPVQPNVRRLHNQDCLIRLNRDLHLGRLWLGMHDMLCVN